MFYDIVLFKQHTIQSLLIVYVPGKPLHNRNIVTVYYNSFPCMKISEILTRHFCMLTYIYLNVDEC